MLKSHKLGEAKTHEIREKVFKYLGCLISVIHIFLSLNVILTLSDDPELEKRQVCEVDPSNAV